ncbi:PREDICTED: low-density lipoprotein receptor-related protein 2-like [Ceratosolen solmsi marchali]|uniref:Low-density lipoprotein receptor-related protein 2-like n=1 Tax=Ceratosolen solmsi marchali TaxID=326594 RepID=A0AAJ7E0J8_9HYME|nr:PREDICTED: low-density lipoprotein receptor-related protein 2-like [Ceratosolen solmsi marchali]
MLGILEIIKIAVLIILLCAHVRGLPNTGNDLATNSTIKLIFNMKDGKVWQINVNDKSEPKIVSNTIVATEKCHTNVTVPGRANIVDLDYDTGKSRVLWMSWNERLYSSSISNNNSDQLIFWYDYYDYLQFSSRRIAVDHVNEKLYSIDRFINPTVEVVDFDGKQRSILSSFETLGKIKDYVFAGKMPVELENADYAGMLFVQEFPMEIAIDPTEGLMFIRTNISWASRIHRINLDGTSLKIVILNAGRIKNNCCRLDVDRLTKRIYWNDCEKGIIESSDYNGNDRVTVIKADDSVALAVYNNHLFWSQNSTDVSTRAIIKECKLRNNTCRADIIRNIILKDIGDVPYKIKVAGLVDKNNISNPCAIDNGKCQQLCLLKHSDSSLSQSNLSYGCACKIGYKLSSNSKDCEPILKYLVYESNNYIRGKTLNPLTDNKTYNFPPQFVWGILEKDQIASIDFNPLTNKLLYLECRNLLQIDLDENLRGCWSIARFQSDCYKDLAYDWQSGKIYTTKLLGSNGTYVLGAVNVPSTFKRRAFVKPDNLRTIDRPLSLVVHPKTGFLYLLTFNALFNKSTITCMKVGGYDPMKLNIIGSGNIIGLAIDNNKDRLYWFTDSGEIQYSNLNGTDIKTLIVKSPISQINSMIIDEDWIYIKNNISIWQINKDTGGNTTCIVPETKDTILRSGMKIIERSQDNLHYGVNYQITKAACKVFCAYKDEIDKENKNPDAEFCKCSK